MAQQFEKLVDCLDFIEKLKSFGMEPTADLLREKERLEELENVIESEYIFSTMRINNPFMTEAKEQVVREMTEQLLCDEENAAQPCLLLGKVQCGKTDTFLSIVWLCFDRGIDIAVVMTKGTNTLTNQTITRLNREFRFFKDRQEYGQKVIVSVYDILDLGHRGGLGEYQLNDPANKFIIVAKKEDTNLRYLNELFEKSELLRNKRVLVCDDEADFASRNYYLRKGEVSLMRIAEQIEHFITIPYYCRYLQITATPYSLYLQPDGTVQLRDGDEASPWLPRYTSLVPIHDRYVGGKEYFELSADADSMYSCLFQAVDEECIDILSARNEFFLKHNAHSDKLGSLNYAIVSYLFASAVRSIQVKQKSNKKYLSSCLIHCEVSKKNHQWQEELITRIINAIRDAFVGNANSDLHILDLESEAYESLKASNELGSKSGLINDKFPTLIEIEAEVKRILEYKDIAINVVNSENPVSTMLNENGQLRLERSLNFFIGGNILDRGITIDNMLCFFYGRDPRKFQMDTVLQHARMYGARDKEDMACTRFFTTEAIYDVLKTINGIDSTMYDYLKTHRDTVQTNEFVSMVIGYDKRIKASAANKYTPSNTKVLRPAQRILPVGFQTGTKNEISEIIKRIDELVSTCDGYKDITDENPFFLMPYETAAEIITLISTTWRYGKEYDNEDYEFDLTEMMTALEHCTFGTDGMIYCLLRTNRNMSRERDWQMRKNKTRWIDAPDDGRTDYARSKEIAEERPVLMLLKQNGLRERGWRNTEFYWPVFVVQQNVQPGIFTINGNKKFNADRVLVNKPKIKNIPKEGVLFVCVKKSVLIGIVAKIEDRLQYAIKRTTCSMFLEKDEFGNYVRIPGLEDEKYYSISSYNNGKFPFEITKYKYIYLRTTMDFSGSQVLIELDGNYPYRLVASRFTQNDIVYNARGKSRKETDESLCDWNIEFRVGKVLDYYFTANDEIYYTDIIGGKEQIDND